MTALPPLTHHDILALAEPYARQGRHVDLAASDRSKRHIAFRAVEHLGQGVDQPGSLRETLLLECLDSGNFRLTRTLRHADSGLQASLRVFGRESGPLLQALDTVPPWQQFRFADAYALALGQRVDEQGRVVISQGRVRLDGLVVVMEVSAVRGVAAEIRLEGPLADAGLLPQDLLAVQGWSWTRLARNASGWHSRVRLRGPEPQRSQRALQRLQQVAGHLSHTLAEAPARYHERHRLARWAVVFRRGIPVLTLVLLALGLWVLSRMASGMSEETGVWILLLHVPTAMLAIGFSLQEMAQFEIPPLPRPLPASAWQAGAATAGSSDALGRPDPASG